ncbi:MAG: hypothetical protein JNK78_13645 [Planctomycetes bacterium]|nr:hypothetical protein [Planctomycetota bacterium]
MQRRTLLVLALAATAACGDLMAQSNSRGTSASPISSGYNGALENISGANYWGRRGSAFPNGELAVSFTNQLCNPGGLDLAWFAADNSPVGSQMSEDHPKFGFIVAREVNGRLVQISDWSYCKHAFLSLNDPGSCGTCANGASAETMYVGCSDVYTFNNNGSRTYLGPPAEINPWLGTWNHVGSYFDAWPGASPTDGIKGSTPAFDAVEHRVTVKEASLGGTVTSGLYFQIHVIHEGEPIENRGNNTMSRPFTLSWSGTNWSTTTTGSATYGSILTRWTGSTMAIGQNGGGLWNNTDDGRFAVAVKVTGPTNGVWHYEYIVHNIDNNRGGAAFRLPVCPTAQVTNIGFRDIDQDALNDWTSSFSGGTLSWTAPLSNPQNWNTMFNFWFDSDAAPVSGTSTIDEAAVGPGALTVSVPTSVPGYQPLVNLGPGCGTPAMTITGSGGFPVTGNPSFGLTFTSAPGTLFIPLFSNPIAGGTIIPGCDLFIDLGAYGDLGGWITDGAGVSTIPTGVDITWSSLNIQALTLIPSPPILGIVGLSSGVTVRYNGTGCN